LNDSTGKDTTADTSISRMESIILGNNNLQIKTRMLDLSPQLGQTRNVSGLDDSTVKRSAKKGGNRNSIQATQRLDPIQENTHSLRELEKSDSIVIF